MVAVEEKPSLRILGGKRRRRTSSVSSVASHNEQRSLTNDQHEQGRIVDIVVSLCRGGENIRSIPVVQSSESPYNFVSSCLCGENNSIGSGGDSRRDGISADNIVVAGCLNNVGLDQFGRIANQNWVNSSTGASVDNYTYTYDHNSNVTAKNNVLNSAYSETYTYDSLNRLTAVKRNGAAYQSWNLDSQGNWSSSTTGTVTQTRTANAQNQITSITGTTGTPAYDSNGKPGDLLRSAPGFRHPCLNMTADQNGNKLVYDAWNRLVSVTNSAGQIIAAYTYDARGYRVSESYPVGGNGVAAGTVNYPGAAAHTGSGRSGFRAVEHSDFLGSTPIPLNIHYNAGWQAVETRTNGTAASDVTSQMVWSAAYINAAILQDTYSAGVIQPNSRLYYLQDANWDTTAVVGFNSTAGTWGATQRYVYSPYGSITILNADWSTPPTGTQPLVNNLYQGMTLDAVTGLYYSRNRNYDTSLGTWISQDPLQYVNGANTYQFVLGNPIKNTDSSGDQAYGVTPYVQPSTGGGSQFLKGWGDAIIEGGVYGVAGGAGAVMIATGPEDVPGICIGAGGLGIVGGAGGLVGYPLVHLFEWGWGLVAK